ncbi:Hyaluronan-binding protein 2 [Mactra antiquata]
MNSRILYILLFLFVSDILASYGRNYGNRSTRQGGFGKISSSAYVHKSQPISAAERYKLIKQQMSSFTSNTPTGKRSSYSGTSSSVSSTSNLGNGRSRFSGRSSYNGRSSFNGLSSNSGLSSRHGQTKSSISSNVNKGSTSSSTNTHNLSPAERYKLSRQSQGSRSRYGSSSSSSSPNNGRSSSFGKSQFPSSSSNINKGSASSSTNTHNLSPAERYKLSKQSQGSSSRYGSSLSSSSPNNGRSSSFGKSQFPSSSSNINKGSTSSSTNTHNLSPAERYKLSKQSQGSSSRYGSRLSSYSLSNGRSSSFGRSHFPSSSSNINKGSTSSSTNTHNLSPAERYKLSKQSQGSSSRYGSSLSSNSPSNGRSSSFGKSLFPSSSFSVNKGSTSSSTNTHNLSPAERYKLSKQSQGSSSRYGSSLSSNSPSNGRSSSFGKSQFPSSSSNINKGSTSSSTNTHNLSPAERYKLSKQSQGSSSRYGSSLSSSSLNNGRSSSFGRSQFPSSSSNGAVSSSSSQKTKSKHTLNLFDQYKLSQLNQQKTTISSTVANSRNFGFGSKQNSNWLQNSGIITTTPVSKEGFGVVSAGVNKELLSGNTHNLSPLERLKLLRQSTENDLTEFRKCLDCIPKDSKLSNSQNNGRNYVATTPKSFVYTPIESTSKSVDMKNFLSHSGSASLTASSSNTHTQVKTNGALQLDNTHIYNPVDRLKKMREQNGQSVPGSVCLDCETPPKKNDNNKAQDKKVQDNGDNNKIKDNIPTDKNIKSPWKAMADETTTLAVETSKPGTWGSDICSPNPCKNGGTCKIDSYNPKEFECACPLKYRGKFCHEVTVKCDILGCNVTEECISTPAGGVCTCVVNGVVENCLIDTALKSDWG